MRRFRQQLPLFASLALHAGLAALLLRAWVEPSPSAEPAAVIVDLADFAAEPSDLPSFTSSKPLSQPAVSKTNSHAGAGGKSTAQGARPNNNISGLGLANLRPGGANPLENPLRPGEYVPDTDDFSAYAPSEGAFQAKDIAAFGAYNWIHQKVQLNLGYPGAFIRNGIEGRAQARFQFSAEGQLLPESIRVLADSPYLRVYVHRLLEQAFRELPVPAHMRRWRDRLEVLAFVQFSLVESRVAVSVGIPTPIVGNRLFFARKSAEGKNALDKLRWRVGPVHGLFPVPAVGVDMLWFAEQAKKAGGRQEHPVDELAPWREDPLFHPGS